MALTLFYKNTVGQAVGVVSVPLGKHLLDEAVSGPREEG